MRNIITAFLCFLTFSKVYPQAAGTLNKNFGTSGVVTNNFKYNGSNSTFFVQAENCFALGNGKLILLLNLQGWVVVSQRLPNGKTDSSYGKNGFSASLRISNPVAAVQPDGKILIAGTTLGNNEDFIIARLNGDGSLDKQFGNSGVTITDAGSDADILSAVSLLPNGQIIAGGQTVRNNTNDFALVRYTSTGKVDASFGQNGIVITSLGGSSNVTTLAIQPDSKILAAGNFNNGTTFFAAVRYKTNGALDTSFNHNGFAMASPGNSASVTSMALSSGKIIVGGYSYDPTGNSQFNILQLTSSGAIDSSFGNYGWTYSNFAGPYQTLTSLHINANGRILTGGYAESTGGTTQFALARFLPNGNPDSSFGTYGQVLTSLTDSTQDYSTCIFLQTNGEILLGGYAVPNDNNEEFGLARYQSNGSIDSSFASNGILLGTYPDQSYYYSNILVQPDGRLIVFGNVYEAYNTFQSYLWRYTANGAIDPNYGQNGRASTIAGSNFAVMQSDGKVVIAGSETINYTDSIQVSRYLTNGNLDPSYGTLGIERVLLQPYYVEFPTAVAIQSDNKTIVAGWQENFLGDANGLNGIITRFNSNGTVDSGFGVSGLTNFNVGFLGIAEYLSIQPNGKILLTGYYETPSYQFFAFLMRLKSNGNIDSSFGQNGVITFNVGAETFPQGLFSLSNGKILLGNFSTSDYVNYNVYVTRLNANGTTDSSYGSNGSIGISGGLLFLEPDQKLLVSSGVLDGQDNGEFLLNRYLTNGNPDLTFGKKGTLEALLSPGSAGIDGAAFTGNEMAGAGTADNPYGVGLLAEINLGNQVTAAANADITVPTDAGMCSTVIKNIESLITGSGESNARFNLAGASEGTVATPLSHYAFNKGLTRIHYYFGSDTASAGEFTVNVVDEEAPLISSIGKLLDNKAGTDNLVALRLSYDASDNCGSARTSITFNGESRIVSDHLLRLPPVPGVYTIQVSATDESDNKSVKEDTVIVPASILNSVDEFVISSYPNPSTNYFSVHISSARENGPLTLQLFNDKGVLIETVSHALPGQTLQLGGSASSGVYFLKAIQQGEVMNIKLVKL
ncbi:MAG TPA: T9SS type A sorting domain-containing protein [Puia sp.]|nr:T9SS type A sorting domain-containing protein [Puia sp.]